MLTKTKIALCTAILLSAAFSASAATKARVTQDNQVATYDTMPGYDGSGATVAIPNPDRQHS
jgi:hypothetical protein